MKQMMLVAVGLIASGFAPSVGSSGSLEAQHPAATHRVATRETSALQRDAWRVLDRQVSVQFEKVPVKDALARLATEANVSIQYQADVFYGVQRSVTMRVTNAEFGGVIQTILEGTGLQAVPFADDGVTIVRRSGSVAAVQGTIVGKVTDAKTGKPVSGATVTLGDASSGVTTGSDGVFRLSASVGEHTVRIRALGFVRQSKTVAITGEETITVDVQLATSASVLDEVIVTGTVVETERKAIPTPITVITAEEIEKRAITRIDQLFRGEVPGLLVAEDGTEAYSAGDPRYITQAGKMDEVRMFARGAANVYGSESANPIKTYIDGVELFDPSFLGTIDPQSIERIEIVVGPQAATIYGSGALGGVMQIFTKRGNGLSRRDVTLNLKYGALESSNSTGKAPSHNHMLSISGGLGQAFSYSGTMTYNYTGQWQPKLYNRGFGTSLGATYMEGPVRVSASMAARYGSNGAQDISGIEGGPLWNEKIKSGEWKKSGGSTTLPDLANGQVSQRVATSMSQTFSVNLDYKVSNLWQHQLTIGRNLSTFEVTPKSPSFTVVADSLYQTAKRDGARTSAAYSTTVLTPRDVWTTADITIGANRTSGSDVNVGGCFNEVGTTRWRDCAFSTRQISIRGGDARMGGFTNIRLGILRQLYLTFGLRAEKNDNYGRDHKIDWTPTNGIAYTVEVGDATVKFLGSYGKATRAPTPGYKLEIVSSSPTTTPASYIARAENPDLRPEYSRGPQVGMELYYGSIASLTVNHFNQKVTDLIQYVTIDSTLLTKIADSDQYWVIMRQYLNAATVRQLGWEGTGSLRLGALSLKGTWSWSDSRILQVHPLLQSSFTPRQSFENLPTHSGNLTVAYAAGPVSATLSSDFMGARIINQYQNIMYFDTGSWARLNQYIVRRKGLGQYYFSGPGYTKSHLSTFYRISPNTSLTLHITNLGNSFASDNRALVQSLGRQTLIGVSLRYP